MSLKIINTMSKRYSGFEGASPIWDEQKFISTVKKSRYLKMVSGDVELYKLGSDILVKTEYRGTFITHHEAWHGVRMIQVNNRDYLSDTLDGEYLLHGKYTVKCIRV